MKALKDTKSRQDRERTPRYQAQCPPPMDSFEQGRGWDVEWEGRWICKQFIVAGVWGPKVLRAGGFREMKTSSGVGKT